jgi:hypothetical protein
MGRQIDLALHFELEAASCWATSLIRARLFLIFAKALLAGRACLEVLEKEGKILLYMTH